MILPEYEDSSEEGVGTSTMSTVCPSVEFTTVSDASCGAQGIIPEISGKSQDIWWEGLDYQTWIMVAAIYMGLFLFLRFIEVMKGVLNVGRKYNSFCKNVVLGCLAVCPRNRGFNPRRVRGDPIIRTRNPSEGTTATWGDVRANSGFEEVELQAVPPSKFFFYKK